MNTKDAEMLEQQRQRRKRINRMKSTIVMTIAIWMIASLLTIIILSVQVIKLNSRVYILELQQKQTSMEDSSKVTGDENVSYESETTQEESDIDYSKVVTGIETPDNVAEEGDSHRVYLTFDCNPGLNTEEILDALKDSGVKATFFVDGNDSEEAEQIYKRIVDEGHTLGMNSYSNQYSTIYSSTKAFKDDYEKISDFLYKITGVKSLYYRFPGGSGNEISNVNMAEFVKILNDNDITFFDYNVTAGDTSSNYTVESVVENVVSGVKKYKTSVVLLHDDENKSTTAEAIGPLIEALQNMQAEVLPIDENTYVVQYIKADSVE